MGVTSYLVVGGEIISETRNGVKSDYIPDPLGSTAALINASGTITDTFTYWPYGQVRSHVGSSVTPFSFVGTLGYYADVVSGRLYVRARVYVPNLTRWLTVDPLWPAESSCVYVDSNPISLIDPTGTTGCPSNVCDPVDIRLAKQACGRRNMKYGGCWLKLVSTVTYACPAGFRTIWTCAVIANCISNRKRKILGWQDRIRAAIWNLRGSRACMPACQFACTVECPSCDNATCDNFCNGVCLG